MGRRAEFGRPTCERYRPIDVRDWHRDGNLVPGKTFDQSWTFGGKPAGTVSIRVTGDTAVLTGCWLNESGNWEPVVQRLHITWTGCRFGGQRPWFRCNGLRNGTPCGRRVAL